MSDQYMRISCSTLQPLSPVLRSWIACVQRYIDVWDGDDLPYWYNERANISILAGAAWKADWTAIEEYQITKVATEASQQGTSIGRNDLYVANEIYGFCIEAKVAYVDIEDLNTAKKHIVGRCSQAIFDAGRLDYDEPRLGAVFVAPYSVGVEASEEQIRLFQESILTCDSQALAWLTPTNAMKTASHDNKYYPMVALMLMTV
ncbi:MAG: hypothetical protein AAAB16_14830 [Pseudomonas sp.]|uniref:hypothetical protein n=1 Tax=Pseudomonas sp. TaxID=306 RepID=UPI0030F27B23